MHVLMLGWEFPPYISGGLGTACHGLTRALDRRGVEISFGLPHAVGGDESSHVRLLSPGAAGSGQFGESAAGDSATDQSAPLPRLRFLNIPAGFVSPYQRTAGHQPVGACHLSTSDGGPTPGVSVEDLAREQMPAAPGREAELKPLDHYSGELLDQVMAYAKFCLNAARHLSFDVIHAHDWMTYPAGLALAAATGRPLVVHVHSTEFDRCGENADSLISDIERRGVNAAARVVAVSELTRQTVVRRYQVAADRITVVYNGVEMEPSAAARIQRKDRIVLYFGRITYQKGPEYFIRAATRVLEHVEDVKFVVAGSGDMAQHMIEMAADLGIGHKVLFTGFLRGRDISLVFSLADLYVMPSVTEPFGIAPLEAICHDVPVLISKSSGVSEVLSHALKADFWDIDDMADKIIAVLRHPPLGRTLREHGAFEVRRLTWDGAAEQCQAVYSDVIRSSAAARTWRAPATLGV